MDNKFIFESFESVSEQDWWNKIEKDLKGKALESLNIEIEDGISTAPLYMDKGSYKQNIVTANNDWFVCEAVISVTNEVQTNKEMLSALTGGANALELSITQVEINFEQLFKDIHLDYINLIFSAVPKAQVKTFVEGFLSYCNDKKYQNIKWSLRTDRGFLIKDIPIILDIIQLSRKHQQKPIACLHLDVNPTISYSEQVSAALKFANLWIEQLLDKALPIQDIAHLFSFKLDISSKFFPEIAKLRALNHLWLHLLEAYGLETSAPKVIHAYTVSNTNIENPYWDMIAATTQCLSAAISTVNLITVRPVILSEAQATFSRRIARNIQHLLKNESYIHKVSNPIDGAYYVEQLTQSIASKAWLSIL